MMVLGFSKRKPRKPSLLSSSRRPNQPVLADNIAPPATTAPYVVPHVEVLSVTLSGGDTIEFAPDDIVVVVGPNNAGKSAFLREIETASQAKGFGAVVKEMRLRRTGAASDVANYLQSIGSSRKDGSYTQYIGYNYSIRSDHVEFSWEKPVGELGSIFVRRIGTEDRLTVGNPTRSIDVLERQPSHPIHVMYVDENVERNVSSLFSEAFGVDLFVYHLGGTEWPLMVGKMPALEPGENRTSSGFLKKVRDQCRPLHQQGDGMRSFGSILLESFVNTVPSVTLLDEPEAFLHPPQAKLVGQILGRGLVERQQFVATHSPDVLDGLLSAASNRLKILRLTRSGEKNFGKVLQSDALREIATDPLLRYSGVLSAAFRDRVVICEGDSDCLFYEAIRDAVTENAVGQSDIAFLHANGKHRMPQLCRAARNIGVRVDAIVDMDVMREKSDIRALVEAFDLRWSDVEKLWLPLFKDIDARRKEIDPLLVAGAIEERLAAVRSSRRLDEAERDTIRGLLKTASPWDGLKTGGEAALPSGDPTSRYRELRDMLRSVGIWFVPVGELEGFCKRFSGKSGWVQKVLESVDLRGDPELDSARLFVRELLSAG